MAAKRKFNLASLVALMIILSFFIFLQQTKKSYTESAAECGNGQAASCLAADGSTGYRICRDGGYSQCFAVSLDGCKLDSKQLALVCCREPSGEILPCNGKTNFRPGDYVFVKTNLQKAMEASGINTESYKTCGFSSLSINYPETPGNPEKTTEFYDGAALTGCSGLFYSAQFHQGTTAGFIPNIRGKTKISEWRVYPETTELLTPSDAISNIDSSTAIFSLEVNVGE